MAKVATKENVITLFTETTVAASGTATSSAIEVTGISGYFSLQWRIRGSGTVKFEVLTANNTALFLNASSDITTGQNSTSGPANNGDNIASFLVPPCKKIKILATETAGASSAYVSAWLKAI